MNFVYYHLEKYLFTKVSKTIIMYNTKMICTYYYYDAELKKAVEILKDKTFYKDILSGKYVEEVKKKGK